MKEIILAKCTDTSEKIGEFDNPRKASNYLRIKHALVYYVLRGKQKNIWYKGRKITFRRLLKDEDGNYKRP